MLYKNIVTCDESDSTDHILTTLAALNLQIFLYVDKLENSNLFLKHIRAEEINYTLLNYVKTYDLVPCIKVLQIIKADLKAFEYINKLGFKDLDDIRSNWTSERNFSPAITAVESEAKLKGWQKAVKRSYAWEEE